LQDCFVDNASHVTLSAQGDHVARIQYALFALDRLKIDRQELLAQFYGRSTASAVLSYKTKRAIINRSYQNAPDNIVGKMTIASLDKEMLNLEAPGIARGDCILSPPGVPQFLGADGPKTDALGFAATGAGRVQTDSRKQLHKALRIYCSITKKSALESGFPLAVHIERAKDSLFDHGITLSVEIANGFADQINFPDRIVLSEDVDRIRKTSEDVRPGLPGILRVIVCQMNNFEFGETFRNRKAGDILFPPFVLMNSLQIDLSHATLLHEMIHAANNGPIPHDPEPHSIFFEFGTTQLGTVERTFLKPNHAATLAKSFFAV
jgi:hypothetical protein